jgi:diguanylate cyclase
MTVNPSSVARQALRQLAEQKIPPTPENYARAYFDIASPGAGAGELPPLSLLREVVAEMERRNGETAPECTNLGRALDAGDWKTAQAALRRVIDGGGVRWGALLRDVVQQLDARTPGITAGRKREALAHVLASFGNAPDVLHLRLRGLIASWGNGDAGVDAPIGIPLAAVAVNGAAIAAGAPSVNGGAGLPPGSLSAAPGIEFAGVPTAMGPAGEGAAVSDAVAEPSARVPELREMGELLALTLTTAVADRLGVDPDSRETARLLADEARALRDAPTVAQLTPRVRQLCIALEMRNGDVRQVHSGLLRVVHALTTNVAEMLGDDPWLQGQFKAVAELASGPLDRGQIARLERALREIVYKQGTLKQSMDEAKNALRTMTATFIDRLAMLAADTGEHSERLDRYAAEIQRTTDLGQLSNLVVRLVHDTRGKQSDFGRMHEELVDARRSADVYGDRVRRLERELEALSDRLHEDQLTELLNRRGLDRQFDIEISRAQRSGEPLCVCLLDIDDFKRINDTHGHQVGDQALVHLAQVLRQAVRPFDVVARFGGEEFVILLPATHAKEAGNVMGRVQRDLTRRYFLHNNERLLVTFSAGVTEAAEGETAEVLLARADRALYQAKERGKNRVVTQ